MTEPSDSNFDVDSVDDINWSPLFNATHKWGDSMTEHPATQTTYPILLPKLPHTGTGSC